MSFELVFEFTGFIPFECVLETVSRQPSVRRIFPAEFLDKKCYAVMADRKKVFTMQGVGTLVSPVGQLLERLTIECDTTILDKVGDFSLLEENIHVFTCLT